MSSVFTETQLKMITPNGNIYRYIGNDIVDEFNIGDCADIFFPNGYGKGKRTFQGIAPCLNTTTTAGCFIVKEEQMENNNIVTATLDEYNHKINGTDTIGTIQAMYPVQNHGHRVIENPLRIRKLTPTECFRLMGVKDEDSCKLDHLSNSTKYHLAGDSIVVNVLQAIFKSVLVDHPVLENKPIRLIEFFAGYGSQALALKYLGIPFESWRICEWAYKSIDAYKHIHYFEDNTDHSEFLSKDDIVDLLYERGISSNWNEPMKKEQIARKKESELREIYNNIKATYNLVNIQQVHAKDLGMVNRDNYNYIWTYSFPCQDLSLAGKGAGMEKGSGTRSGMLWEVERILEECGDELPQLLLMENVPQVAGTKNKEHFNKWIEFLESKGYTNKWCMLNAKEVGYPEPIPQNRNRCFMVSVLNPKCNIVFPEKTERTMVLKDLLEHNVDEKYYLSEKQIDSIKNSTFMTKKNSIQKDDHCGTLLARDWKDPKCVEEQVAEIRCDEGIRTFKENCCGSLRTIDACGDKVILIKEATKQGYKEARDGDGVNICGRMEYQRGNVQKQSTQTITTAGGNDRSVVLENKWSDLD